MAFMISGMSKLLISAAYQGSLVTPYRWLDWNSWWNIETDAAVILPSEELFPGQNWKGQRRGNGSSSICFDSSEPRIQLYFLLGLVYAAVTLFLLPFILVFFLGSHMLSSPPGTEPLLRVYWSSNPLGVFKWFWISCLIWVLFACVIR